MAKAVKVARLYPLENPICSRAVTDLIAAMQDLFDRRRSIRFTVSRGGLLFAGESVLERDEEMESLVARLFRDGIREISFHQGLTGEELLQFLGLFRADQRVCESGADDLVTLLWHKQLSHVTYVVIDDLIGLGEESDSVPEEFENPWIGRSDLEVVDEDVDDVVEKSEALAERIRAQLKDEDVALFGVSDNEKAAIVDELREEMDPDNAMRDFIGIVSQVLFEETEEGPFIDLAMTLSRVTEHLMVEGRLEEVGGILRSLHAVATQGKDHTPAMRAAIDSAMRSAWGSEARRVLIDHLDGEDLPAMKGLASFVQALPDEAIGWLCGILGELKVARARRHLIDALVVKGHGKVAPFLPFLKSPLWYVVRNIALILGRVENKGAVGPLRELIHHDDLRVRLEAITALERLKPGECTALLGEALHDPDPHVRIFAARGLGAKGTEGVPILLSSVQERGFLKREIDEIGAFYEALGYAGGSLMVPFLAGISNRRNIFRRRRVDEIRAAACHALGCTGAQEGTAPLSARRKDRSDIVRAAAQSGLSRIAADSEATRSRAA